MLLRFGVENYRSIRDYQELLLSASKYIKHQRLTAPVDLLKEAVVPTAAIYGPNASGKSNLIDAMGEMRQIILRSHTQFGVSDPIPCHSFRLGPAEKRPTRLDCTFTVEEHAQGEPESVYEYGFEYTETEFQREWLYRRVRKERQSTQLLFERTTRDQQVSVDFGSQMRGENKIISRLTRPNSLFLSAAAQNNHPQLTRLFKYFSSQWKINTHEEIMNEKMVVEHLCGYRHLDKLLQLIRQADLGISEIEVKEEDCDQSVVNLRPDRFAVVSKHLPGEKKPLLDSITGDPSYRFKSLHFIHSSTGNQPQAFDYGMESKGTRTLTALLIPALEAISAGSLLVIDELDTSLHPDLARSFLSLFKRKESNPFGAQLVFSTHDVSLLGSGLLCQDEIWVTRKDNQGVSRLKPLTDFKLRSRDNFERAYRQGRLDGIPPTDNFFVEFNGHWVSEKT